VFDLIPETDGWFGLRLRLFGLIPLKARQVQGLRVAVLEVGRDRVLALEQDVAGNTFRSALGTEYAEGPVPAAWKARVGRYGATSPSALLPGFALRETRGVLSLVASGPGTGRVSWVLDPVSDDEAVVLGLGRGGAETVYARRNTGTGRTDGGRGGRGGWRRPTRGTGIPGLEVQPGLYGKECLTGAAAFA